MNILSIFSNRETKSEDGKIYFLANFFSALGDPTTLKILKILSKRQKLCVSDVARELATSISTVSHQMAKLKRIGLIKAKREGKMVCYYLEETPQLKIIENEFLRRY